MWDLKYDTNKLMKQKGSHTKKHKKQKTNVWLSNGKGDGDEGKLGVWN